MKSRGHIPVRTCISCGKKRPKPDLIKMALDNERRLVTDRMGRIGGRGAYVCILPTCLERLAINKHINRHFRAEGNISVAWELTHMTFENK
jgi:uncharacterized protein